MNTLYNESYDPMYGSMYDQSMNMSIYMDENGYYIPVNKLINDSYMNYTPNAIPNTVMNENIVNSFKQVNSNTLTSSVDSSTDLISSPSLVSSPSSVNSAQQVNCVNKDEVKKQRNPLRLLHTGQLDYCKKWNLRMKDYVDPVKQPFFEKVFQAEKILEKDMNENDKLNHFRELCRAKNKEACYWLYVNGYFFAGMVFPKLLNERKIALTTRLKNLKRNRVNQLWKYSNISIYFHPNCKKLLLDLTDCKKPKGVLMKISLLLNYYLKPGDIYMYNPINRAGYKYYSGENIIIYVVYEKLTPVQKTRLKNAWNSKLINGYDISNKWKVILSLDWNIKWITKDDDLNGSWEIRKVRDTQLYTKKKLNLVKSFFTAWLGDYAFKKSFVNHCTLRNIPLWFDC